MADPNLLLTRAKSAMLARDYQLAAKYYKTLISENPDNVDYKIQLGNLYVKAGDDDQAFDVFQVILKSNPENLTVLMALAGINRRKERFDESVAVLEQALLISNNSPEDLATINYNLGFTYRQMGNNDDALRCFENVIAENPKDVLSYNHLGAIHALQGDQQKAIEAYQRGLQFDPNHPILHFNIARSYAEIGDTKKALSHYESALRAKPGWLDAIEEYANLLLKDNKVKEAEDTVQKALKLNPDDVKMHTSMGNVYNRKSIFDNAEIEFKKALSGNDEYKPALTGLAHSLEKQGKHAEAAETIKKVSRLNPDDVAIIKQSAHVLLSANFLSAAYEKISRLWEINPNDPQTISLLAQYYIGKGDEGKVENCFDKIQRVAPDYKDIYRDWGTRYIQKGDTQKAEQYLKTAIQQNPKDAESMMYLGEIYESTKRPEDALAMYKKASRADIFNEFSKKEAEKLEENGINTGIAAGINDINAGFVAGESDLNPLNPFADENNPASFIVKKAENPSLVDDNKLPDLLNDTSNPLNDDFAQFENKTVGEIEMASDNDLLEKNPDENLLDDDFGKDFGNADSESSNSESADSKSADSESADSENSASKDENLLDENPAADTDEKSEENEDGKNQKTVDEDFDFEQFGMEKLKDENSEEISVASIDDLMQEEEVSKGDNPADIEELVDDGAPLDEEDEPEIEFIPDGSDFLENTDEKAEEISEPENRDTRETREKPAKNLQEDDSDSQLDDEDEETDAPEMLDYSNWKPDSEDKNSEKSEKSPSELSDEIDSLKDQIKSASEMAEAAKDSAEKLLSSFQDEIPFDDNLPEKELADDFYVEPENSEEADDSEDEPEILDELDENLEENPAENDENLGDLPSESDVNPDFLPEEDSVSEKEEFEAAEKPADELTPEELMMKRAIDMLPDIVRGLEDRAMFFRFKNYLEMFKSLRKMLEYLPDTKREEFLSSENRILLDYIISKLAGRPGLFATVQGLFSSGIIHENPALKGSDNNGVELAKEVFANLRRLSDCLDDETLRIALNSKNDELLRKL